MKSVVFLIISLFLFSQTIFAQTDPVLLTIAGENITKSEFLYVYNKNNTKDNQISEESIKDYLELFINYKLKVKEAEALQLDSSKSFKNELAGYRRQLAQPYLSNREVTDNLLNEAYDRLQWDIRAAHILVKLSPNASPADTLKAYKKITDIRSKLIKGENFEKVAKLYSEDESAKDRTVSDNLIKGNGGDLGYFSVLNLFYEFENAVYKTKVGEISEPIRTPVGYHIIKVTDKKPALGKVQVAHILVKDEDKSSKNKINEAYEKLMNGEKFEDVATQYSDDKGSVAKGGVLPWFGSFRMSPEFILPLYSMKVGETSKPIKTSYGWHIVKLLDHKPIGSFDEEKNNLKNRISRDGRSFLAKDKLINKLKAEYNVKTDEKVLAELKPMLTDSLFALTWRVPEGNKSLEKTVLTIAENKYTLNDFGTYLVFRQSQIKTGDDKFMFAKSVYSQFEEEMILEYENSKLETKYPEFKSLMSEYRDGILLFNLMDQNVWTKAIKDTTGLKNYYETIKNNYKYKERADAVIFSCKDNNSFSALQKLMKKAVKKNYAPEFICNKINTDTIPAVTFQTLKVEKGVNNLIDETPWNKNQVSAFASKNNIVWIKNIIAPEPKPLSEVKGIVTAEYQNYLENEWVKSLRKKYSWSINEPVLKSLY